MTINEGYKFIYANEDCDYHGVFMGYIGSPNTDHNDESSNLIMTKSSNKMTWDYHGKEYTEPLQFKIVVIKSNGNFINANDERELKKWLCKDNFYWLQIEQDDLSEVYYSCMFINPRKVNVGAMSGGMEFTVFCNSVTAFSGLIKKYYQTTSGTLSLGLNITTDFDDYIVSPTWKITPTSSGTIRFTNSTTNEYMEFTNCVANEVITVDSSNDIIESSNGRAMLDNWNKKFLELIQATNNITVTGNCTFELSYRLPIRVGG